MKDRAAKEKIDGGKAGARVERQTIPLSLLQLSIPASISTAVDAMGHPSPITNQQVETVAVSIAPATVSMTMNQPLPTAVVVTGTMVQVGLCFLSFANDLHNTFAAHPLFLIWLSFTLTFFITGLTNNKMML